MEGRTTARIPQDANRAESLDSTTRLNQPSPHISSPCHFRSWPVWLLFVGCISAAAGFSAWWAVDRYQQPPSSFLREVEVLSRRAEEIAALEQFGSVLTEDISTDQEAKLNRYRKHIRGGGEFTGEAFAVLISLSAATDVDLRHVVNFPNLTRFDLAATKVTDAGLAHLTGLTRLCHLDLSHNRITDAGLAHLAGMNELRTLDLSATQVTDAGLEQLRGLKDLDSIDVNETGVTNAGYWRFVDHCLRLKHRLRIKATRGTVGDVNVLDSQLFTIVFPRPAKSAEQIPKTETIHLRMRPGSHDGQDVGDFAQVANDEGTGISWHLYYFKIIDRGTKIQVGKEVFDISQTKKCIAIGTDGSARLTSPIKVERRPPRSFIVNGI